MAAVTVEISDKLLEKLRQTGKSAQEIVTQTIEIALEQNIDYPVESVQVELSREELLQRLLAAGLIREPGSWDTEGARAWRELPQEEKERHIKEMQSMYFPDAPASRAIIRGRKRLDTDVSRAEVERRLRQAKLIRPKRVWNTIEARRWEALSDHEKEKFIAEMNELYFPDAPASTYITENRR